MTRRRLTGPAAAMALALPGAPPMLLPGDASTAAVRADRATWIVGARRSAGSSRVARRAGARHLTAGVWLVSRARARPLAAALRRRGALLFAEPNRLSSRAQAPPPDPLSSQTPWRDALVDPSLAPPAVTPDSPLLALIDSQLDAAHPEFQGGNVTTLGGQPVVNEHGTATAAVAAAPANGTGILGIWPGMRALNVPLPGEITCADSVNGIVTAVKQNAKVINMSYGSPSLCFAEYLAIQGATGRGVTVVAAAGNEFANGNPLEFPASLPH
ncbi:MAG TPA: S8 family serine peptidase, partial [Solirubrobacteraceae bacterium]